MSLPEAVGQPKRLFFSAQEAEKIERFAAEIVPAVAGKPGAVESGVVAFLDFLVSRSPVKDQRLYREGLAKLQNLDSLKQPWTYAEPASLEARFARRLKDDVLRATFNSREWASQRRGAGQNYYWKPVE